MKSLGYLLKRNVSAARVVGFVISNFLGLAIVMTGVQLWCDVRGLTCDSDNFLNADYLVINKHVSAADMFDGPSAGFTRSELDDLATQPWLSDMGVFESARYHVSASVNTGDRGLSTSLFFESVPDRFIDAGDGQWGFDERIPEVPVIISKDYLALYNFGFADAAGLPRLSEGLMSGIPLRLYLNARDGSRQQVLNGRITGYSTRFNTILVPDSFMRWSNKLLAPAQESLPSRVILKVNSPGNAAIAEYLEAHQYEPAGDNRNSTAAYLLNLSAGIVGGIGLVITALSILILVLSLSLLLERSRNRIHSLLMLGYNPSVIERPYVMLTMRWSLIAWLLACCAVLALRTLYSGVLESLDVRMPFPWAAPAVGLGLTLITILLNYYKIRSSVHGAWRK